MPTNKSNPIYYVLPSLSISGGVAVVLQHANRLSQLGYNVTIITLSGNIGDLDWFENKVPIKPKEFSLINNENSIVIATHWSTVEYVKKHGNRKIYFVQSDERRFVLSEDELKACWDTYRIDFEFMTEAKWIQRWLKEEFNKDVYYVPNGIDLNVFHTSSKYKKHKRARVLIEGPVDNHFKGVEEAYMAVKDLDVDIWLVSSSIKPPSYWRINRVFNEVKMSNMKDIYSACDILVKLSRVEGFFGPPLEAMACGCAVVVGKCTGMDEYVVDNVNALVVPKGDIWEAKNAVEKLLNNEKLRKKLIINGYKTVEHWNWEKSIRMLEKVISKQKVVKYYTKNKPVIYDFRYEMSEMLYQILLAKNTAKYYNQQILELQTRVGYLENTIHSILNGKVISKYLKLKNKIMRDKLKLTKILFFRKENSSSKLIIIIGRGHGGTRLISECLEKSGVYMGKTNKSGDHVPARSLYKASYIAGSRVKQIDQYEWDFGGLVQTKPDDLYISYINRYTKTILSNRAQVKGWKLPETILSYPWVTQLFPDAYYIHWTRDPRDALTGDHITDCLSYWNIPSKYTTVSDNSKIESWIYQRRIVDATPKPKNYIHIQYEDFVCSQKKTLKKLEKFLGIKLIPVDVNKNKIVGKKLKNFPHKELKKYLYIKEGFIHKYLVRQK